jgi:hypothetical protein
VEYGKQFDEGDEVSLVDYKTKETVYGIFKKHTKFWDDFPGANVQIIIKGSEGEKDTKKTKILSYNSLTLVKKAEPAAEPAEKVEEKKESKKTSKKTEKTEK